MAYTGRLRTRASALETPCQPNPSQDASRREALLSNTLVVPLAPKQAMYNHDRISIGLARVIMEPIRKIDGSQIRRRVE
jgi:hypothetical protein